MTDETLKTASPAPPDGDRVALSRARILDAALQIVDAEGLEALSMRRLGAALGVEAMSLYHHFASKEEVLHGLVVAVLGRVPLPEAVPLDWREAVRDGFIAFRQVMLAHPAVFPLVSSKPATDGESLMPVARAYAVLEAAGFDPRGVASAFNTLLSYAFGFIQCEISGVSTATQGEEMLRLVREQAGSDFAALRTAQPVLRDWDADAEFAIGLDVVIAGLCARLASAAGSAGAGRNDADR